VALGFGLSSAAFSQERTSELGSETALRVCADPANKPMSSQDGEGFENKIADLVARELGRPVQYTWFPMATGFLRKTLLDNRCDVIMGYIQLGERVLNTNHYYTSGYLLVTAKDSPLSGVTSLSDPVLKGKKLGVIAGSAPASHLVRHGMMRDAKGYELFVDRRYQDPSGDMLADLEAGTIDGALMWGPVAGPLVKAGHPNLTAEPLLKEPGQPKMFYRITMAVRPGEKAWARKLNSIIRRNQGEIDAILRDAGVPLLDDMGTGPKPANG
jgi:quinoprotein dehydrogenase-associated probable ABC transporter substrate-binding protein